ncbi:twin-arginine translocase TatA/TatE family subunit [Chloroflexota bacterium]
MDFFGLGEILIIALVALLIWGPDKLPEVLRTLGKISSTLKKASTDLTTQVKKELEVIEEKPEPQPKASNEEKEDKPAETGTAEENTEETPLPDDM